MSFWEEREENHNAKEFKVGKAKIELINLNKLARRSPGDRWKDREKH